MKCAAPMRHWLQSATRGRSATFCRGLTTQSYSSSLSDFEPYFHKKIGDGSFGAVYEGLHFESGRSVAIKTVFPACIVENDGQREDFISAIELEHKCFKHMLETDVAHPHVVDLVAHFAATGAEAQERGLELPEPLVKIPDEELNFFVMEHLTGQSLVEHIENNDLSEDEEEVQKITLAVCKALQYLHSQGIVHRDVKPANVISTEAGVWKLIDFGCAAALPKHLRGDSVLDDLVGTPGYVAPEVLAGKAKYGPKADVFSLGCTIHAMLTNMYLPRRHPHLGIVTHGPLPVSELCEDLLNSLISENPEDRPTVDEIFQHPWMQSV